MSLSNKTSQNLVTFQELILKESIKYSIPIFAYQSLCKYESSLIVETKNLLLSCYILKNHINFNYKVLSCISGVDLLNKAYRFLISYDFLSLTNSSRIRLKVFIDENVYNPSITGIYVSANWWEREIWDLYGIYFLDHKDLRRILTDYGFEGYPLRKDFPVFGFTECRYDNTKKTIVQQNVVLSQLYRNFNYTTPW